MLLLLAFLLPMVGGAFMIKLKEEGRRRTASTVLILATDLLLIAALFFGRSLTVIRFTENVTMSFGFDNFGRIAAAAAACLYTAVCFYAYEYMRMEERPEQFFAFFFISFGALIAVCMSSNLITMYLFFEILTLSTVPLVLHELTKEAVTAGLKYLFYANYGLFLAAVMIGIVGFGTKAGMYPMHGWLPAAHPIAPAPASSLLSGIVAKAGVVCVVRLVYYSVGADNIRGTWVQTAWMCLAMLTVFMGSMMAFCEKIMKKRLAYSTISQISYIMLGLSFLSPEGLKGGLLHLMQHAASKGCLFLVAGVFIYKLGVRNVTDLKGIGRRMPVTMWCFTIASLSLVGIPPLGGFVSKWVIASAALSYGVVPFAYLAPAVLLVSALLTAGYLLPVTVDAFFPGRDKEEESAPKAGDAEPSPLMTVPMIALCACTLVVGLFGPAIVSALGF